MTEKIKCSRCKGTGIDPNLEGDQPCKKCSGLKKLDWIQNAREVSLSRQDKCVIFVIKTMNELIEKGFLTGSAFTISKEAEEIAKNFKPTLDEIKEVVMWFKMGGYIK